MFLLGSDGYAEGELFGYLFACKFQMAIRCWAECVAAMFW